MIQEARVYRERDTSWETGRLTPEVESLAYSAKTPKEGRALWAFAWGAAVLIAVLEFDVVWNPPRRIDVTFPLLTIVYASCLGGWYLHTRRRSPWDSLGIASDGWGLAARRPNS